MPRRQWRGRGSAALAMMRVRFDVVVGLFVYTAKDANEPKGLTGVPSEMQKLNYTSAATSRTASRKRVVIALRARALMGRALCRGTEERDSKNAAARRRDASALSIQTLMADGALADSP